jgi:hypothetical protein
MRASLFLPSPSTTACRARLAGLPSGALLTTLRLQATLKSASTGEKLALPNGGSYNGSGVGAIQGRDSSQGDNGPGAGDRESDRVGLR